MSKEAAEANKTQQAITEIMSQIQAHDIKPGSKKKRIPLIKLTEPAQTETTEIATKKRSDLKEGLFKPREEVKKKMKSRNKEQKPAPRLK